MNLKTQRSTREERVKFVQAHPELDDRQLVAAMRKAGLIAKSGDVFSGQIAAWRAGKILAREIREFHQSDKERLSQFTAPADEPRFWRLRVPLLGGWIESYARDGDQVRAKITGSAAEARIYIDPPAAHLEDISRRIFPVEKVEASYAEWVEQPAKEKS